MTLAKNSWYWDNEARACVWASQRKGMEPGDFAVGLHIPKSYPGAPTFDMVLLGYKLVRTGVNPVIFNRGIRVYA